MLHWWIGFDKNPAFAGSIWPPWAQHYLPLLLPLIHSAKQEFFTAPRIQRISQRFYNVPRVVTLFSRSYTWIPYTVEIIKLRPCLKLSFFKKEKKKKRKKKEYCRRFSTEDPHWRKSSFWWVEPAGCRTRNSHLLWITWVITGSFLTQAQSDFRGLCAREVGG